MLINDTILAQLPAAVPPPGVTANFVNLISAGYPTFIIIGICAPLITILVWGKFYTKVVVMKKYGWEEYTTILAWALYVAELLSLHLGKRDCVEFDALNI
ncbi:hypothetical protein BJ875DRAFT_489703 [Amylocarpus encephaloides]|uniref:Uncharacterized protein n=1 Tax=Amylocarpus encephaloides TaxID=45428 RepID=A0A9P8C0Y6_9HELO|nr:hypothetical protein BJ875DRAFT_489703 [Amylocarpus encephaloides]